jgi:hypothetical protein
VLRVLTVLIQSMDEFMPIEGEGSASVKFLWVQWIRMSKRVEMLFTWWVYGEFFTFSSCSSLLMLVRSGRRKYEVKMDCTSLQPSWSWSETYRWGPRAWSSLFKKDKENHSPLTWAQLDCHKGEREEERQRDWVCSTLVHWPATSWWGRRLSSTWKCCHQRSQARTTIMVGGPSS